MVRISREHMFLKIAQVFSERASCLRGQVGAVVTINNRIVSSGYNGPVSGEIHCNRVTCDLDSPCKRAVHAELNAILAAANAGISLKGGILYCTMAPCFNCAQAIVQAGIIKVYYMGEYRTKEGIELLNRRGITTEQWKD
jgi:dCMP deaminase